jgi:phage terminase small subunit
MSEKKLSKKELLFIKAYLADPNATQAAIAAGYSEKSARSIGSENLTKPHIKEALELGFKKITEGFDVAAERVIQELARIAFVNMKDLADWNESGVRFKSSDDIGEDAAAAIVEVSETVTQHGGTLRIRQHDKVRALELLGKYKKLFADRIEHSGKDGGPIETKNLSDVPDGVLEAKIQALLAKRGGNA